MAGTLQLQLRGCFNASEHEPCDMAQGAHSNQQTATMTSAQGQQTETPDEGLLLQAADPHEVSYSFGTHCFVVRDS